MYKFVQCAGWAWVSICLVVFIFGAVISGLGAPQWLPLPWSDVDDFVENSDGDIYVGLGFYHRVLRYDATGRFVASYQAPGPKGTHLAADLKGQVYHLSYGKNPQLTVLSRSWQPVAVLTRHSNNTDWRLDAKGEPVPVDSWCAVPVVDRAANPGEYIFSRNTRRKSFVCMDNSTLVLKGNHLERTIADGRVTAVYSSPWFLQPFAFPWPMLSGWILGAFLAYVECRRKRLSQLLGGKSMARLLALDIVLTVSLVTVVGTLWFCGLIFGIDLNNNYFPTGSSWRWVVGAFLVAWFFSGPVVAIRLLKGMQKWIAARASTQAS